MHFILLSLLGGILLFFAGRLFFYGHSSKSWIEVIGEVLDTVNVVETASAERSQRMNHLVVRYRYEVNGSGFEGDRVRFKWNHHNIVSESKKYRPGLKIKVYVNPQRPAESVLEPGLDATNYVAVFAAISAIVIGVLLALFA